MTLRLEIITPEKTAYAADVDSVVIPATNGEMEVLPGHVPLLTMLEPGHLQTNHDGQRDWLAIGSGFVEITENKVIILTDIALSEEQINEVSVEEAIARAQQALREKVSPEEEAALRAGLQKSIVQLSLKRRKTR
ncbi:MAG: ATP synthase F1 subunit epsilon [Verrucomicrobiales bacterium]|jgi:F-type H+-transporting ATPase subunit epsilon|nr:ATP synthase F1 subunit epsilon [Verrucomicrobiales bacterium]